MSDSTSLLDTISTSQAQKEVTANALFDSASFAMMFARRATTTTALTWGFTGGPIFVGGARSYIANGTVTLTASTTNYVEADTAGVVTVATSQTAGKMLLYKVVTGASTVTSHEDHRSPVAMAAFFFQYVAVAMADADKTLTQAQALCATIECSGALTAGRNLVAPTARRRFVVFNNTTGGFAITVKTAAGTGIAVAMGDRATVESDGVNIVLVSGTAGTMFPVSDATFSIKGSADATKVAKFEVDGFTTGTTRTFTLPDANITLLGTSGAGAVNAIPYLSAGNVAVADASKLAFDGTTFSLNGDYSQTSIWNNGATIFTAFKQNVTDTASAAGSLLMDLRVGGVSKLKINKSGTLLLSNGVIGSSPIIAQASTPTSGFAFSGAGQMYYSYAGQVQVAYGASTFQVSSNTEFGWSPSTPDQQAPDLKLFRDSANTLAQRNGTAAQVFRLYNRYDTANDWERLDFDWSLTANIATLRTTASGTGVLRDLYIGTGSNNKWIFDSSGHLKSSSDNTSDIGASGNRSRTGYFGTSVLVSGNGGIGYNAGAGGTVAQLTDKSTGVTLNKVTGQITMNAAALAADTTVSFVLTDSAVAATDLIAMNHVSGGTAGAYTLNAQSAAGSATINVRNVTAGSLSEAIVIGFAVVKAVTA